MKHIFLYFSILSIISCNSRTATTDETTETAETAEITDGKDLNETDAATKNMSVPVPFAGSWISEDYLKSITENQSPRKAQEGSEDVFIHLPSNTQKTATMVYNFHEAISDLVMVSRKGQFELWEKQNDTMSNVKYTIEKMEDDKIKIGQKTFVKINPVITADQPRILEAILFAGRYTDNKGLKVEFKPNGEVIGLGSYKYYLPIIDYFDAGLQVDQVGLGKTREKLEYVAFKFKKDKLELYKLKCNEYDETDKRCLDVSFGEKLYDLQKSTLE